MTVSLALNVLICKEHFSLLKQPENNFHFLGREETSLVINNVKTPTLIAHWFPKASSPFKHESIKDN